MEFLSPDEHYWFLLLGMASQRLERQVLKPRAAVKGVAQSKLILMKKTKTGINP